MLITFYDFKQSRGTVPFSLKQLGRKLDTLLARGGGFTIVEECGGFVLHVYFGAVIRFEYYPPGTDSLVLEGSVTTDQLRELLKKLAAGEPARDFLERCPQACWGEPG